MPFASCNSYALKFPVLFSGFHVFFFLWRKLPWCLVGPGESGWVSQAGDCSLNQQIWDSVGSLGTHWVCTVPGWHKRLHSLAAPSLPSSCTGLVGRRSPQETSPQLGTLTDTAQHLSPHCAGPWLMVRGRAGTHCSICPCSLDASAQLHLCGGPALGASCLWPFSFFMAFRGFSL